MVRPVYGAAQPGGHVIARPPSTCTWAWKTRLVGVRPGVEDRAVAALGEPLLRGDGGRRRASRGQRRPRVPPARARRRRARGARGTTSTWVGRLRVEVAEGQRSLVLVHDRRPGSSRATIRQNRQSVGVRVGIAHETSVSARQPAARGCASWVRETVERGRARAPRAQRPRQAADEAIAELYAAHWTGPGPAGLAAAARRPRGRGGRPGRLHRRAPALGLRCATTQSAAAYLRRAVVNGARSGLRHRGVEQRYLARGAGASPRHTARHTEPSAEERALEPRATTTR